jgi:hypothetical protein
MSTRAWSVDEPARSWSPDRLHGAVPGVRSNAPAVQLVDDRRTCRNKTPQQSVLALYHFDGIFYRAFSRTLELPRTTRALGVNALDEVPDSTWFTNRVGVRDVTPTELVTGPAPVGSPEPHKPWTIIAGKTSGSPSASIKDARGERFLPARAIGHPERETAPADVNKLMWPTTLPKNTSCSFAPTR